MLPEAVQGTYQQYKQDQACLTTWLSKAAVKCGYDINLLTKPSTTKKQRKQKGGIQRYTISAYEIKTQAKIIAAFKPPITLPSSVLKALKATIEARKSIAGWYISNQTGDEYSDYSHQLFIDSLEVVLHTLSTLPQGHVSPDTVKSRKSSSAGNAYSPKSSPERPTAAAISLENKFNGLVIEQASPEQNEWLPTTVKARPKQEASPSISVELESDVDEDKKFELLCFFKDICAIRKHLAGLWSQYAAGDLDLIVASFLTNTAISCVKDMEEALATKHGFEAEDYHLDVFGDLFLDIDRDSEDLCDVGDAMGCEDHVHREFNEFDDVNATIRNFLSQYIETAHRWDDCINFDGGEGPIHPLELLTPLKAIELDKTLLGKSHTSANEHRALTNLLNETNFMLSFFLAGETHKTKSEFLPEDMLTQGVKSMIVESIVPVWLVFACRVFLDARKLLGIQSLAPLKDMKGHAANIKTQMDVQTPNASLKTWMGCPSCVRCATPELRRLDFHLRFVAGEQKIDKWKLLFADSYARDPLKGWMKADQNPWAFFEHNMLSCGTLSLSLLLDFEKIGIEYERRYSATTITSHLYNCSRLLDTIEVVPIPRLDNFIQKQGYVLFGTAMPKTFKASYDCFLRSSGASPKPSAQRKHKTSDSFTFRAHAMRAIRPNRTFDFLRQYLHQNASMGATLHSLISQSGQSSTLEDSICGRMNVVTVLSLIKQRLSIQLAETRKSNYWSLTIKCIWALSMIRDKLNSAHGGQHKINDNFSQASQALMRWTVMTSCLLKGAGEAALGECLHGLSAADQPEVAACSCCATPQLKEAMGILERVFASHPEEAKIRDGKKEVKSQSVVQEHRSNL